ncbi:hypothetical protein DMN91_009533 [Ooceraea biroi]|uniref:THAP-type domain-containing protein n=1 Tax=Ooceraea biroi TaxID=2015173 RepID=A0A3L8D9W1_OOCBI|nr:uncharacterized protein LOC113562744 [Ooceraea biroi]RLU17300.1 hypothetical protein DMN91_009533 [Ooceraea biroi]
MTIRCKLCGRYWEKNDNTSFHSIPKDPILRKQWIEACKLHKVVKSYFNKLSSIKICSVHFDANSYIPQVKNNNKAYLKPNAVPRMNIEEKHNLIQQNEAPCITGQEVTLQQQCLPNQSSYEEADLNICTIDEVSTVQETEKSNSRNKDAEQVMCIPTKETINNDVTNASSVNRKTWQPACVTQLTEEHFTMLERRQRYLSLLKRKLKAKEKMIKKLRNQNKRLSKKVAISANLLAKFKNKKLIIVDAATTLLVCEKIAELGN